MDGRRSAPARTADAGEPVVLTLLSRAYCHLCDEMEAALAPLVARHAARLVVLDVDSEPALEARFGERVPVLIAGRPGAGVELCHYRLDSAAVERALAGRHAPR